MLVWLSLSPKGECLPRTAPTSLALSWTLLRQSEAGAASYLLPWLSPVS